MTERPLFSIVVPAYNAAGYLSGCLDSLMAQRFPAAGFEVLVVDDASADETRELAGGYPTGRVRVFSRTDNGGPGAARNLGVDEARGEWILFVDGDDRVTPDYLARLAAAIDADSRAEAIGFSWARPGSMAEKRADFAVGRRDARYLDDKAARIAAFLGGRMDGSVIYTAVRKALLDRHALRFDGGLHEDIDFLFRVYLYAGRIAYVDEPLYLKQHREDSIINTVSAAHIDGFVRAWRRIGEVIGGYTGDDVGDAFADYPLGLVGVIASRVKEIRRQATAPDEVPALFERLYRQAGEVLPLTQVLAAARAGHTSYCRIATLFIETLRREDITLEQKVQHVLQEVADMEGKSWSCQDLHYSLFLRPDEVRTCCRRFFVDNERRGDVVLFQFDGNQDVAITPDQILAAKRDLHHKLNTGEPSPCDGCHFMEYKDWGAMNALEVRYISLEHHSICNLRCSYCSEEYYAGKRPEYDFAATIEGLHLAGSLENCHTVVWGGGEPTALKEFDSLVEQMATIAPKARHRMVTNAVKRSDKLRWLLDEGRMQIATSIDAGSEAVFVTVRGGNKLHKVLENLRYYAEGHPHLVTIKYIFTHGNGSLHDVKGFVKLIEEYGLQDCLFQVSMDFKLENVTAAELRNMVILYGLLRAAGSWAVYFDEIILQRLSELKDPQALQIDTISEVVGQNFIATPGEYPSVVVWGASENARNLVSKSLFFKGAEVAFFVDSSQEKQGQPFCGREVRPPEALKGLDVPVLITAVQGYSAITRQLDQIGYRKEHIVDKLVI